MIENPSSHLVCPLCTYVTNSPQATKCEICGTSLKIAVQNSSLPEQISIFRSKYLLLVTLILVSIGINRLISESYSKKVHLGVQQGILSNQSDIRLFKNMKAVPDVPQGLFSYGGAICFAALARDGMNEAIGHAHERFRLRYVEPKFSNRGYTTGIKMLLEGELSLAQNSRPLSNEELAVAKLRGFELESVPVAIDGIVFYVNPSLGIKSLSLQQLKDIYWGKIKNWQEVGGKNLPIVPISLEPKIDGILQLLMEEKNISQITDRAIMVRDYTRAIRKTASTEGAISYASSAILKGQSSIEPIALAATSNSPPISALLADGTVNLQAFEKNIYPLTRRLFVVIRRDGTPEEKAGIAYTNLVLSEEGQKIVRQAGFVPLFH